jgi:hypothetical protein
MPYEDYLQTAHWRVRRNQALKLARYHCSRCQVTRDLQVHHTSYERLGEEWDDDLEVLCRGCHLGHHVVEVEHSLGVYFKIVEDVLKAERFTMVADLIEAVKVRCAELRIPYSGGQVTTVIARMKDDRLRIAVPKKYAELTERGEGYEPFTKPEAAAMMLKWGGFAAIKHMPSVPRFTPKQADSLRLVRMLGQAAQDSIDRCQALERAVAEDVFAQVEAADKL